MQARYKLSMALGVAVLMGGCQGHIRETYQFPLTWPGTQPLSEGAPTVSVQPIQFDLAESEPRAVGRVGLPTTAVLSALFIKHLHVNGVNAILEQAEGSTAHYTLGCTVPQLEYGIQKTGYPRERIYKAELSCTLNDALAGEVVWTRSLKQNYEKVVLWNLMTKLPEPVHEHDRVLYRECIVPLWDAMASTVGTVLVSRREIAPPRAPSETLPVAARGED